MQKRDDSKISRQIINKKYLDMHLKVKFSSESLYKIMKENFTFLNIYSDMIYILFQRNYININRSPILKYVFRHDPKYFLNT